MEIVGMVAELVCYSGLLYVAFGFLKRLCKSLDASDRAEIERNELMKQQGEYYRILISKLEDMEDGETIT